MNVHCKRDRIAIASWLALCALLVACMVMVGGYTRLSGSGLSITQWKPVHGVMPPIGEAQWQEEFDAYKQSPQYEKINRGMSVDEFKTIFWPEFFHRLLGRAVGIVFFLPLLAFALRRSVSLAFGLRLLGIFALGGVQGLIGWLMVKSGLVDQPYVNPLRLALHLGTAFVIYGLIVWALLDVLKKNSAASQRDALLWGWFGSLCIQIFMGALVAGNHAGLIYNTFPTMDGQWVPDGLVQQGSWMGNVTLVQFIHRWLATAVALGFFVWWGIKRKAMMGHAPALVGGLIVAQFGLGVLTLLRQAPLDLALAHQMTALLLFTSAVYLLYCASISPLPAIMRND
jgi:cytochrome c oxidase assembly protein subunit 15